MSQLEQARAKVRKLQFGTQEWEDAMEEVRELVDQENAKMDMVGWNCDSDGQWWV